MSLQELTEDAVVRGLGRIMIIDRWQGGPGRIKLYNICQGRLVQVAPQVHIRGIRLQREFGEKAKRVDSLVIVKNEDEPSSEIRKLSDVLSDFLSLPVLDNEEVSSFYGAAMRIYRDMTRSMHLSFFSLPGMIEKGPRITIAHLTW